MKKQFIEFLKKNRCYKKFMTNYANQLVAWGWNLEEFFIKTPSEDYIHAAFIWPDGEIRLWSILNAKWKITNQLCQSNCDRPATHWLECEKIYLCDICTEHHLRFELPGIPERIVLTEYNKHFDYNLTT